MGKTPANCPYCSTKFNSQKLYTRHIRDKRCKVLNKFESQLGDENKEANELKVKNKPQIISSEKALDDDIIMLEEDIPTEDDIIVNSINNGIAVTKEHEASANTIPLSNPEQEDDAPDTKDDEVEVLKANIFKFQGDLTYEQEVSQDILHFKYFDDFNDEDIIVLDDVPETDEEWKFEGDIIEEERTFVSCEECNKLFEEMGDLEDHKQAVHPPKKKKIMEFDGGNFFMLAV